MDFAEDFGAKDDTFFCIKCQDHPLTSVSNILTVLTVRFVQMMSLTFGLFTQVSDSGPHGPLDSNGVIKLALFKLD